MTAKEWQDKFDDLGWELCCPSPRVYPPEAPLVMFVPAATFKEDSELCCGACAEWWPDEPIAKQLCKMDIAIHELYCFAQARTADYEGFL